MRPLHLPITLTFLLCACALLACRADDPTPPQTPDTSTLDTGEIISESDIVSADADPSTDAEPDAEPDADPLPACATRLFGRPSPMTGLSDDQCGPACGCGDAEKVGLIPTDAQIDALLTLTLSNPPAPLTDDPYANPDAALSAPTDGVCAVTIDGTSYAFGSFADEATARAAGAVVTHGGACGLCSPLQDLAVYMRYPDLTEPVRACGLRTFQEGDAAGLDCIRGLGFTEPCAQIWFFNTRHTREVCLGECLRLLSAPYHRSDGSLNACILCDEVKSGDVFKAVAGRTRRNTGLPSALCRPCEEVRALSHDYGLTP